jgi:NTP pyrophosphatase (non-canonical NTP hydrolase)
MSLAEYASGAAETDRLPRNQLAPALMGLFGEVGQILTTAKKRVREEDVYTEYHESVREEFGDALWYLAAVCSRLEVPLADAFELEGEAMKKTIFASDVVDGPVSHVLSSPTQPELEGALGALGQAAAALLSIDAKGAPATQVLKNFSARYVCALQAAGVTFSEVARQNLKKVRGRFILPDLGTLPMFDDKFEREEQLPWQFEIRITQRKSGQSYLQWNGVFVGDPLTDNILDRDGYRFHDVFHFGHAAVLHWSPTFRSLIKQKRKSDKEYDEAQDGGRAIVVEEGLTAYIFSRAKKLRYFEGRSGVSYDLLKTVQQFVRGYEVDQCPLSLWERAILQGYEVFRSVRERNGGVVIGNRERRTLEYRPS